MEIVFAVAGVALIVTALVDALWTTLWIDGAAGPVTRRTTTWGWRAVLAVIGRTRHKALSLYGPMVLVATLAGWIVMLAAGWVLVYAADPGALYSTSDGAVTAWSARIWFVAYTMFTVGNGDFLPQPGFWQLASSLVAVTGMVLVTLAISYLLSVISAVVAKRAFASQVSALGGSPTELILTGWNGRDLRALDRQLSELSGQLGRLTQQYQSYPVLQYYHSARESQSPILAVATLDEALTVMRFGVAEAARPSAVELTSARASVKSFLGTLESALISPAPHPPGAPSLEPLRAHGLPTVDDEQFSRAADGLHDRRERLLGVVRGDGWKWER